MQPKPGCNNYKNNINNHQREYSQKQQEPYIATQAEKVTLTCIYIFIYKKNNNNEKKQQQCKIDCHFKIKSIKNIQKVIHRTEARMNDAGGQKGAGTFGAGKVFGGLVCSDGERQQTKATVCTRRPSVCPGTN